MERALYLSKYRNIGFNENNKNHSERIVLNHSLKKGEMGDLVILVGANNSGKSNILDALYNFGQKKFEDRDKTTLTYDKEYGKPQLSLVSKEENDEYEYRITYGEPNPYIKYPKQKEECFSSEQLLDIAHEVEKLKTKIKETINYYNNNYRYGYGEFDGLNIYVNKCDEILSLLQDPNSEKRNVINQIKLMAKSIKENDNRWYKYAWDKFIEQSKDGYIVKWAKGLEDKEEINTIYYQKYNMPFIPNIIKYSEEKINGNKIHCAPDRLKDNSFFVALLDKIGYSIDEINNNYSAFVEQNENKAVLTELQKKLNREIEKKISQEFNKLYFTDNEQYKFEISLEGREIYFSIFRGDKALNIDYQSDGFKWFFNLYFNLLCKTSLTAGDVIIMDEPATNLHVKGQMELRKFLKEFAIKNDLTIVIATHSPFLIDLDYLDELRVVSNVNNISHIYNDFSTIDTSDPDSLKPIKHALTTNNHVLYDPDKKIVFVEGITDYNYLTAFRNKLMEDKNIIFLPINGVGDISKEGYKEKQLEISKELISIKKHNPILLVDGDKAGKSIAKINEKDSNLTVITLPDINPEFRAIETVFSQDDRKKYKIDKKSSSQSALIKTFIEKKRFDDVTTANFKQIFDKLEEL